MELKELPLVLMRKSISNPRQSALDELCSFSIPQRILRKYEHPEDIASALDGAFTAFHMHAHLSRGGDKAPWLDEALYWYDLENEKDPTGPFFSALRNTLDAFGIGGFYNEIENHIMKEKGKIK